MDKSAAKPHKKGFSVPTKKSEIQAKKDGKNSQNVQAEDNQARKKKKQKCLLDKKEDDLCKSNKTECKKKSDKTYQNKQKQQPLSLSDDKENGESLQKDLKKSKPKAVKDPKKKSDKSSQDGQKPHLSSSDKEKEETLKKDMKESKSKDCKKKTDKSCRDREKTPLSSIDNSETLQADLKELKSKDCEKKSDKSCQDGQKMPLSSSNSDKENEEILPKDLRESETKGNSSESKQKGSLPHMSLTNEEYEEIFKNVLTASDNTDIPVSNLKEEDGSSKPSRDKEMEKKAADNDHHMQHRATLKNEKKIKPEMNDPRKPQFKKKKIRELGCGFEKVTKAKKIKLKKVSDQNGEISVEVDEYEEEGTWIQCSKTHCGKWRYMPDIQDPSSVPDIWDCSMNSDVLHKSCTDPEEIYDESEHILTKFTIGSIVSVKMDGFPWWPAMVESDPDYDTYFELPNEDCMIPSMYHVTFFGQCASRAWIKPSRIVPYMKKAARLKVSNKHNSSKAEMESAINQAEEAFSMTLKNRLLKFGFAGRYKSSKSKKKTFEKPREDDEEMDCENVEKLPTKKRTPPEDSQSNSSKSKKLKLKHKPKIQQENTLSLDQHVPDINNLDIELEEADILLDNEMNSCSPVIAKAVNESNPLKDNSKDPKLTEVPTKHEEIEELALKVGPVPDIDDWQSNHDENQDEIKEEEELSVLDLDLGKEKTQPVDKYRYGRFHGHCSDHGSDSDPLDLIED